MALGGSADLRLYVEGLGELRRSLKKCEQVEDSAELQAGLKAAAEIVASDARLRANAFSFTAADTIRATSGGNRVYIVGGKSALPWYGWGDFGSRTPKFGQARSVGPWAHSGPGPKGGRWIYPALEHERHNVEEAVADALDKAVRAAGFESS